MGKRQDGMQFEAHTFYPRICNGANCHHAREDARGGATARERLETISYREGKPIMGIDELPLFLTPKQLSQLTGEHENSIRRGINEGRIPADMVNGRWRIYRNVVFKNAIAYEQLRTNTQASDNSTEEVTFQ